MAPWTRSFPYRRPDHDVETRPVGAVHGRRPGLGRRYIEANAGVPAMEAPVSDSSQRRATENDRRRLAERGMARFEVLGRAADRELIRSLARRLAEDGPQAERLRAVVASGIAGRQPRKGGILEALRRSPLVGADAVPTRPFEPGREVDL